MKVRFLQDTTFEGRRYALASEHDLPTEKARALGSSVEVLEQEQPKPAAKEVKAAPRTTAIKSAPKSK